MPFAMQNPATDGQPPAELNPQGNVDPNAAQQQAVQQPGQPESGKPEAGSTEPEALTLDAIRKVVRDETREEVSKAFRGIQSANAKLEERVKADFNKKITDLKKIGISPTEEQIRAILDQTRESVLTEADGKGKTGEQSPAPQEIAEQQKIDPTIGIALDMIKESGLDSIDENDPEYTLIDQKTDSKGIFLKSVQNAIDTKLARLQTQGNTRARNPLTGGTGKVTGSGIANVNNVDDLYKRAFQK